MALASGRSPCTHSRGRGERPLPGLRTVDYSQKSVLLKKKKMQNQKAGQKKYPNGKWEVTQAFILSHPPPY